MDIEPFDSDDDSSETTRNLLFGSNKFNRNLNSPNNWVPYIVVSLDHHHSDTDQYIETTIPDLTTNNDRHKIRRNIILHENGTSISANGQNSGMNSGKLNENDESNCVEKLSPTDYENIKKSSFDRFRYATSHLWEMQDKSHEALIPMNSGKKYPATTTTTTTTTTTITLAESFNTTPTTPTTNISIITPTTNAISVCSAESSTKIIDANTTMSMIPLETSNKFKNVEESEKSYTINVPIISCEATYLYEMELERLEGNEIFYESIKDTLEVEEIDEETKLKQIEHFNERINSETTKFRLGDYEWNSLRDQPVLSKDLERCNKMRDFLSNKIIDMENLIKFTWNGIPKPFRCCTWKILMDYMPVNHTTRFKTLRRKRAQYWNEVQRYFVTRDKMNKVTFNQIHIDILRMNPGITLFAQKRVQQIFERVLFIWSIRRPASGYVQGINDVVTPFFVVFLSEFAQMHNVGELLKYNATALPHSVLAVIEADCYWCVSSVLDRIQNNYIFNLPGIQDKLQDLENIVKKVNMQIHEHLKHHKIKYLQFAFRWINSLLLRELPLRCVVRLWDTYLSQDESFQEFHQYVCAVFLNRFHKEVLRENDFQDLLMLLQNCPTHKWNDDDVRLLTAEAYLYKFLYSDAPGHECKRTVSEY
ncbi:hypothetical protein SNEBB_009071 [Seison nebaliae]|nr:hypothetical protein SNEBB_009071 [Seison nebaliae]